MEKELFARHRKKLANILEDQSLVVLFAGEAPVKSGDEPYVFSPNPNFYYLTGIDEPKVIFMMRKNGQTVEEILFIEEANPKMERWVGRTITEEEAKEKSDINDIVFLHDFHSSVHNALQEEYISHVYLDFDRSGWDAPLTLPHYFAKELFEKYPYVKIHNLHGDLCEYRVRKSPEEVEAIRKAIRMTQEGLESIMHHIRPGMMEYELEAFFDYTLNTHGIKERAFPTIVGAGLNATILHYGANRCKVEDGALVLFDLGARLNHYNADITRTFPANGRFTDRQRQFYQLVLKTLTETTDLVKPGLKHAELQKHAKHVLATGCRELGLIEKEEELSRYYWHGVSHLLGLDTHDVGHHKDRVLEPGMVLTVEPGIYVAEERIGIRIEDDILVTEGGHENLSKDIIRTVEEIETFMAGS